MSDNIPHNGRNVLKRKSKPFTQDNKDYEPAPSRSKRLRWGPTQLRASSNKNYKSNKEGMLVSRIQNFARNIHPFYDLNM